MNRTQITDTTFQIPASAVLETYRGRPGCGCGCRGTYSKTTRAINSRTAFINDAIADGCYVYASEPMENYGDNGETVIIYTFDNDGISVWLYVNADEMPGAASSPAHPHAGQANYNVSVIAEFGTDLRPRYSFDVTRSPLDGGAKTVEMDLRTVLTMDEVDTILAANGFVRAERFTEWETAGGRRVHSARLRKMEA